MNIYFYGAGKRGLKALREYEKDGKEQRITGFIDSAKKGELEGVVIKNLLEITDVKATVVITPSDKGIINEIYDTLKKQGFSNIYRYTPEWNNQKQVHFLDRCCEYIGDWGDTVLKQVEMHIVDGCNLNCRGCSHFSPIFDQGVFPDFESRLQDVKKLKEKFTYIKEFFLLGGEPFLNPEIDRYIRAIREELPKTTLTIVTNGLLVPSLKSSTLKTIVETDTRISISEYEPTCVLIDRIRARLNEYGVIYNVRNFDIKQKFNKPLSLNKNSTREHLCISDGCITIWNHKISKCPTLMYIGEFNKKFGTSFPEAGTLPLDTKLSSKELLKYLNAPVSLCTYCVKNEIPWGQCERKVELSDFVTHD